VQSNIITDANPESIAASFADSQGINLILLMAKLFIEMVKKTHSFLMVMMIYLVVMEIFHSLVNLVSK
jgi:hypothetical protein